MKPQARRSLFRVLLLLFAVTVLWWLLYIPFDKSAVLRPFPSNVVYASVHDGLAARWPDLAGSPVARSMLCSAGIKRTDLDKVLGKPATAKWVGRLAGRRMAIAYAPSLGGTRAEAWLFSSWIGGYCQRLLWMESLGMVGELRRLGMHGRHRIWGATVPGMRANLKVSVGMSEGVLMVCVSSVPQGVRYMLDAFDGAQGARSLSEDPAALPGVAALRSGGAPDRGWVSCGGGIPAFCFELSELRGSNCFGRVWTQSAWPGVDGPPIDAAGMKELAMFLGDTPEIVCLFRPSHARLMLDSKNAPAGYRIAAELIRRSAGDDKGKHMFLSLFGGKYRARMKSLLPEGVVDMLSDGVPVPVVMCGLEVDDDDATDRLADEMLDRLNGELKLGIISQPRTVGDQMLTVFEGTGKGSYSRLGAEERAAFTVSGGWLIFSSNVEVLSRLVARRQRDEAAGEAASSRWLRRLEADGRPAAWAWADLAAAGITLKDGLALWKLSLADDQSNAGRRTRGNLAVAMDWMDAVKQLNEGSMSLVVTNTHAEMKFRHGEL